MSIIKTENLNRNYQQGSVTVRALQDVNLEIQRGDFAVLAGPSGSGKTTLLNMLGALDKPSSGKVWLDEHEITGLSRRQQSQLRRDRIGFVFQFYNLIPVLTAFENAEFVLLLQGVDHNVRKEKVTELLRKVGLEGLEKRKPHPLPLIVAAETIGIACENCVYVGDDLRDIIAGRAANMKTLIAAYGYIKHDANLDEWQAEGIIEHPLDLLSHPLLD